MMAYKVRIILLYFSSIILFSSCEKNTNEQKREVHIDCLIANYEKMTSILDTASLGDRDGQYPVESADELVAAMENLQVGISKGMADMFVLQYEADTYCVNAEKAIESFENSLQFTLDPGTNAELIVYGIDQKGRIEFGASPAFGGGDAYSVEAWLKYDEGFYESGLGEFIGTFDNSGQPYEGWMINFLGDNLRATISMGPQPSRVLEWGSKYPTNYNEWNHIVMVYDQSLQEGQLKLYVNGKVFFSKTNDIFDNSGVQQSYSPNTRNVNMWAFQEPTDLSRCMTGYIKKFRFWNSAKSESEVNALMSSDVSGEELDLVCAWDFSKVPEDNENITDKTGNFSAKLVGKYKWIEVKN